MIYNLNERNERREYESESVPLSFLSRHFLSSFYDTYLIYNHYYWNCVSKPNYEIVMNAYIFCFSVWKYLEYGCHSIHFGTNNELQ